MRVKKINEYCNWIIEHFKEISSFNDFVKKEELVYSAAFVLSQIGELAKNVDQDQKRLYANVPWHNIVGLRNKIIHNYSGINQKIIYDICTNDIPKLLGDLNNINIE